MMIDIKDKNLNYNISYLVCVPNSRVEHSDALEYTLGNVCIFEPTEEYVEKMVEFCVKNQIKKIILVDYTLEYERIILQLQDYKIEFYNYLLVEMGALSSQWYRDAFNGGIELYKNNYIKSIIVADRNMEYVLKNKMQVYYLPLDFPVIQSSNNYKKFGVGLLSDAMDSMHSFYNALSAIKMSGKVANIYQGVRSVKEFGELFAVKTQYMSREQVIRNSEINVYVNFTNNNYRWFFNSMDLGIPCILGNQQIIEPNEELYKLIVVESDDDITEIAEKINYIKGHKKEIMDLYNVFRKEYSKMAEERRDAFLSEFVKEEEAKTDTLLSVIVPIYNVENYLRDAVSSIVRAKIPDMEILLINDGSTDRSGEIAKGLQEKYPDLIRYIEQANCGLGNVRNVGLKEARGKYITSVDSDDLIGAETFKEASIYLNQNVDMVIYDWQSVDVETGNKYVTSAKDGIGNRKNNFEDFLYASIAPSACNKIIKKGLYDEMGLKFSETKYEDLSLNLLLIMKAKSIAYISKPYYIYNLRQGSIMRSSNDGVNFDMIKSLKLLDERLVKFFSDYKNYDELYYYVFFWRIEELILNHVYKKMPVDKEEVFYEEFLPLFKKIYNTEKVKEFFERMPEETKRFYNERNRAILNKRLKEFIEERTLKNIVKLNAANIYGLSEIDLL